MSVRTIVLAVALLVGACSKSDLGTSTPTSTTTPTQAYSPTASTHGVDGGYMMPGMPMDMSHDAGMNHPMPSHP